MDDLRFLLVRDPANSRCGGHARAGGDEERCGISGRASAVPIGMPVHGRAPEAGVKVGTMAGRLAGLIFSYAISENDLSLSFSRSGVLITRVPLL